MNGDKELYKGRIPSPAVPCCLLWVPQQHRLFHGYALLNLGLHLDPPTSTDHHTLHPFLGCPVILNKAVILVTNYVCSLPCDKNGIRGSEMTQF